MKTPGLPVVDPFVLATRYITAPYARGASSQPLGLEPDPSLAGQSKVEGYSFAVFQARFGIQAADLDVTYVLMLQADLGGGPAAVEIDHTGPSSPARLLVPADALPGQSFVVPIPVEDGLVFLEAFREHPVPAAGADRWSLTALLGNTARLLWLLLNEPQVVSATTADVAAQDHVLTARGASLDRLGEALGVPRRLPSPYRLDLDTDTLALYHLDDAVAPVLDATHDHPGDNLGATRGVTGRFGNACTFGPAGAITIPDATAFEIAADQSFTVEAFVRLPRPVPAEALAVLAVKRPKFDSVAGSGWLLSATYLAAGSLRFAFSMTDQEGTVVQAATGDPVPLFEGWFHIAGVLDRATRRVMLYLNGKLAAAVAADALGAVVNYADIGLGGDRQGKSHLTGSLDEVQFSSVARADFSAVLGTTGKPYTPDASTIALYHLDETDDWVDEDLGLHYGVNHGATRGVPARFDAGLRFLGDPLPRPDSAAEREFQRRLITGTWDRTQGTTRVVTGPYARYGYRQGAISLPGLTGAPEPVLVNDQAGVGPTARGLVTSANAGFAPTDLPTTIKAFQDAGRTIQEAIDYFGEWQGQPESFFTQQYQAQKITATHEPCPADPPNPTYVEVPAAPGLVLGASSGLTVEAVIKPPAIADDYPRAIAATRSTGLREDEPPGMEAGWALVLGRFNGIPDNLRWVVGDATGKWITVGAGFGLADGAFHHVAGVLDRDAGLALLYVDGVEVDKTTLDGLGAVDAAGSIFLGNDPALDAPYAGLLDEVRLSSVPRRTFHPVLGESDDRYRQRLAIYTPRRLPTFTTMLRGVRALSLPAAAGPAAPSQSAGLLLDDGPVSDLGQLDVVETDSQRFEAGRQFRVIPATLAFFQSIAADGTSPADESTSAGLGPFDPDALLRLGDTPGLTFVNESARWMVLPAAQAAERLAARVLALNATATIAVHVAWSTIAGGVHALGRALQLTLNSPDPRLDTGLLAALAHQVGVAFVLHGFNLFTRAAYVEVAVAAGPELDLTGPDVAPPGKAVTLSVTRPALKDPGALTWDVIYTGQGNGRLAASGNTAQFTGDTAGAVIVQVRYPLAGGAFLRGVCRLVVAPTVLDGCEVIGGDGREDVSEAETSGQPEGDFQEAYLVRSADPRVDYASEPARRMQLPLETALLGLAALADAEPGAPRVRVVAAYDPAATNLQRVGRGLIVTPSAAGLTAARLGALAFLAGFSYIERRRYPPSVYVSVPLGDRFAIVRGPIERLWPNARISGLGVLEPDEFVAAGPPDAGFTAAMVQPFSNPAVAFATGVSNAMQAGLATALNALIAALQAAGATGQIQVLSGFDPKANTLAGVGRALLIRHPAVAADRLSGYALQAGFGFIQHRPNATGGPAAYVAAYPNAGPPLNIAGPDDLIQDAVTLVSVRPVPSVAGQLDWGLIGPGASAPVLGTAPPDPGQPGPPRKTLSGPVPGGFSLIATFSLRDAAEPYQFLLQARPAPSDGAAPEPRITKDQYDDIMNFLEAFVPVGVAAVARGIRRFVHGFHRTARWDRLAAPATYPRYRVDR
ncbi:MAG TPA: LamG domain-containing protein [Isosphaeraceae bacterium]|jgi:hypothetical protein|nr:LamG domain-containing protein [Isosphaeraceae bacterium]